MNADDPGTLPPDTVGLLEGLTTTRSIRRYRDEPVPPDALRAMLFAATRAPSGSNRQPFRFVVLTDGRNEYPADTDLTGLVRELGGGSSEAALRVFTIAYGEGADLETLRQISAASNAAAYDATRPESIDKVFTAVLSNF